MAEITNPNQHTLYDPKHHDYPANSHHAASPQGESGVARFRGHEACESAALRQRCAGGGHRTSPASWHGQRKALLGQCPSRLAWTRHSRQRHARRGLRTRRSWNFIATLARRSRKRNTDSRNSHSAPRRRRAQLLLSSDSWSTPARRDDRGTRKIPQLGRFNLCPRLPKRRIPGQPSRRPCGSRISGAAMRRFVASAQRALPRDGTATRRDARRLVAAGLPTGAEAEECAQLSPPAAAKSKTARLFVDFRAAEPRPCRSPSNHQNNFKIMNITHLNNRLTAEPMAGR